MKSHGYYLRHVKACLQISKNSQTFHNISENALKFTLWTSSCSKRIGNLASRAKVKCAIRNTAASPLSPRIVHCVMAALLYTRFCIARDLSQTIAMRS